VKSSGVFLVIRGTTRGGAVECLSMPTHVRHVFLTGFPGVGKTTTMLAAIEDLGKVEDALTPEGFFTQEIRDEGKRVGFDVVTVGANPRRGPLARRIEDAGASPRPRHRVGRYAVDVASLEALACPALSGDTLNPKKPARKRFVALDEIGAMECLSDRFEHAAWLALESPTNVVLGSMCVRANDKNGKKHHAFANAVAARPDVAVVVVAPETRDALRVALVDALRGAVIENSQSSKTEKTKNGIFSVPIAPLVPFLERGQRRKLGLEEEEEEEEETEKTERNVTPCGPLVVDGDVHARLLATRRVVKEPFPPPKTLLLGETSSPAPPSTRPELAYAERSMWRVLDEALAVDGEEEGALKEKAIGRRETRRVLAAFRAGLAVWDVAADVHVPGEKRRATATKGERALNDVLGFLKARPSVTAVAFVGEKAWRAFRSASENAAATRETFSNQSSAPRRRWIAVDGRAVAVAVVRSARGDERERREKVREWSEALFGKEGEEAERGGESTIF
jgi:nucleoside-triphosphatase